MTDPFDYGPRCYILDDERRPVKAGLMEWAAWFEKWENRCVAVDQTALFEVSTVFLGIDHRGWRDGPPILFETMVFERKAEIKTIFGRLMPIRPDVEQNRYASWDEAEAGHRATLRRLQKQEADALAKLPKIRAKAKRP
jgi:hypothetical protein